MSNEGEKFKVITHGDRNKWIEKLTEVEDSTSLKSFVELNKFRTKFLKDHLIESVDIDALPTKEVDKMLQELEATMDFRMGLSLFSTTSNTVPSQEKSQAQKQEKTLEQKRG